MSQCIQAVPDETDADWWRDSRYLISQVDSDKIAVRVLEYGFCVVEKFADASEIEMLREDFSRVQENPESYGAYIHADDRKYRVVKFKPHSESPNRANTIHSFFETPELTQVGYSVYQAYGSKVLCCPHNGIAIRSRGVDEPNSGLPFVTHTDPIQALRFFLFLTDVTMDHGPTHLIPGLHHKYRTPRLQWVRSGRLATDRPNQLKHLTHFARPLLCEAGTLVVLDTDTPHFAGHVKPGYIREAVRFDALSKEHSPFEF